MINNNLTDFNKIENANTDITNYEDYIKTGNIKDIIITDKKNIEGYIKLYDNGTYNKICRDSDTKNTENLDYWLNKGESLNYGHDYDYEKIIEDIFKKCYKPKLKIDKLKYNEYICNTEETKIFNISEYKIYDLPNDKILLSQPNDFGFYVKKLKYIKIINDIDNNIFNELMDIYINKDFHIKIKKIFKNIFIEESTDVNIFYDYYSYNYNDYHDYNITTFFNDLSYELTGCLMHIDAVSWYKEEKNKKIPSNIRYVIIYKKDTDNSDFFIDYFTKKGIKNFIILIDSEKNNYNSNNLKKYIENNFNIIKVYIENIYGDIDDKQLRQNDHPNNLFNSCLKLLFNNLVKWCIF